MNTQENNVLNFLAAREARRVRCTVEIEMDAEMLKRFGSPDIQSALIELLNAHSIVTTKFDRLELSQ